MALLRRYGVQDTIQFPLIKRAVVDFAVAADYTPVQSDTRISKDAASDSYAASTITNVSGAVWSLTLSAVELSAQKITITIIDAATKTIEDQALQIETYGSPLAQHAFDLSINTVTVATNSDKTGYALADGALTAGALADSGAAEIAATVWATASRSLTDWAAIVNAVWATGSRTLTSFGTLQGDVVNAVWATPSRTLTSLGSGLIDANAIADSGAAEIAGVVWATASRTVTSFGTLQGDIVNAVWATPSRTLSSFGTLQGDVVNAVWATPSRTLSSIDNVKASVVSSVWATPTRTLSAGVTVAVGGIDSTSFAASALDAAALAQDAAQEVADEMLNRNLAGSGSGGARIVRDALRVLRNKVDLAAATVYQEDDATPAWTFTTTSDALATRIVGVDPS